MRVVLLALNAPPPSSGKLRTKGSRAGTLLEHNLCPRYRHPIHTETLRNHKNLSNSTCINAYLHHKLSHFLSLPDFKPTKNPRHHNLIRLWRYASMKSFLSRLQQPKSQFTLRQQKCATYLTDSFLRSYTQSYAASIPKVNSILLTSR